MGHRANIRISTSAIETSKEAMIYQMVSHITGQGITAESSAEEDFDAFVEAMDEVWNSLGLASWMPSEVEEWKLSGHITEKEEMDWLELCSGFHNELHLAMIEATGGGAK